MQDMEARMLAQRAYKLASKSEGLKNNLTATSAPTINDDKDDGYGVGSTWVYDSTTYTCVDSTVGKAIWQSSSDITTYNTWAELIAVISNVSPSFVGKYAIVANANGAPSANVTYTAPNALTDYIVDGGSATIRILAQGTNYSVKTMPRTITNPIVTSVMLTSSAKYTNKGYYIFTVAPTNGLPAGISLNDIVYCDGNGNWSVWQSYSQANTVLVANNTSGVTQVTWRKFANTWMSTADEYIPDGKEYQTGKLWNGKAVYRICYEGTSPTNGASKVFGVVPITGKILQIFGTIRLLSESCVSFCTSSSIQVMVGASSGNTSIYVSATDYANRPVVIWVEYTKS